MAQHFARPRSLASSILAAGFALWFTLGAVSGLKAQDETPPADEQQTQTDGQTQAHVDSAQLDLLFPQLANSSSAEEARVIANQIWQVWLNPTTPELADRMDRITAARTVGSYQHAIEMLTNVTEEYPDYAEAWNQRATLYFFLGDYEASLADVEETLAREPRHFGALSGQAVILLRLGEEFLARQAILEALKYHPFLSERALFPELFDPPTQT